MEKTYYWANYQSPIGDMMLVSDGKNLIGLWNEGQKYHCGDKFSPVENEDCPVLVQTKKWLVRYFNKEKPAIAELPIGPVGSSFRQRVWEILCNIPYGEVITYGEIAKMLAGGKCAQAVGGAVGHNPISIIIPCHRVVGANGSLTGYAGGIPKKIQLLELEGVNMAKLHVPPGAR